MNQDRYTTPTDSKIVYSKPPIDTPEFLAKCEKLGIDVNNPRSNQVSSVEVLESLITQGHSFEEALKMS